VRERPERKVAPWAGAGQTRERGRALAGVPWPLAAIIAVQAFLSAQLVHANTAFEDEALYLWGGHLEIAHLLHGTRIPPFPTYFSGAPVIYPVLGALEDSLGGLTAARLCSLPFMLGATVLLWATTRRLYGSRAAFFAAAVFGVLGPTLRLGAFATYDAMSLFLITLAAWCVTGGRARQDATWWMLAGAGALVLANATKYASALFDPAVAGLAVLSAYPKPGGKAAWRRGTCFGACAISAIMLLLQLGGGWYATGVGQTTTVRHSGGTAASVVLRSSWDWIGVIIALAVIAVAVSVAAEKTMSGRLLPLLLASTALLVPSEQARIHTYTSLSKHVDFGVWFAAIAVGYGADRAITWLRSRFARIAATAACTVLIIPLAKVGALQSTQLFYWPGSARLIPILDGLTAHGGRFLADNSPVPEYYLPHTSWRQWSSVYGITTPSGRRVAENSNDLAPYAKEIKEGYFSVIVLGFSDKPQLDRSIADYLENDKAYRLVATVPFSSRGDSGSYLVWQYDPQGSVPGGNSG